MLEAFLWGAFPASSLIIGGAVALWRPVPRRTLGLVLAFGAGVLVSAVAYELALEAFAEAGGWRGAPALGFFLGVATFFVGDTLIEPARVVRGDRQPARGGPQRPLDPRALGRDHPRERRRVAGQTR